MGMYGLKCLSTFRTSFFLRRARLMIAINSRFNQGYDLRDAKWSAVVVLHIHSSWTFKYINTNDSIVQCFFIQIL